MLIQKPALLFASSTYNSAAQFNLNQISKDQRAMLHSQNEIVHVFFFTSSYFIISIAEHNHEESHRHL